MLVKMKNATKSNLISFTIYIVRWVDDVDKKQLKKKCDMEPFPTKKRTEMISVADIFLCIHNDYYENGFDKKRKLL